MNEDAQGIPQSWTTIFSRYQKKGRLETHYDKPNVTYETTDALTRKKGNRRTALERSRKEKKKKKHYWAWMGEEGWGVGGMGGGGLKPVLLKDGISRIA